MEIYFLIFLIGLMAFALGSGYPVAFALPGAAIISIGVAAASGYLFAGDADAYFLEGSAINWLSAGVTNFRGIYWEVERDTLIAIPLFIFMGVGATVVAMGLISLPAMLQRNYSPALASGTICASGTLGQIIPPSIVLIILADQLASAVDQAGSSRQALYKAATGELQMPSEYGVLSTSAGDMFMGAFVPGLLLVGIYMLFILIFAFLRPKYAPAVEYDGEYDASFYGRVVLTLVPPLALIVLVLGSIITGIATGNCLFSGTDRHRIIGGDRLCDLELRHEYQSHRQRRGSLWHHGRSGRCRRVDLRADLEWLAHVQDRGHIARRDDRHRQDNLAGVHHPAGRGDADLCLPRLWR